jgi:hypothetical protein
MEDEKQVVRDLLAKPYSRRGLHDAIEAFKDLSGKDRRALMAEFNSSQLGKDFENLSRQFAQVTKKLAPQLEAVAEMGWKKAIIHLSGNADASIRGIKSGEARRAEAEETWKPHALKLAIAIRKEHKAISQVDLAGEIKLRWTLVIGCPKTQLVPAISKWEQDGDLAKRNK